MILGDVDIVYMVKDAVYNDELRYSLRSVEENFPYKQVWFIGGKPMYAHPDQQIIVNQKGGTKWDRVRAMLRMVAENDKITEDFVLFNDDFFILQPLAGLPSFSYGSLRQLCKRVEKKNGDRPTPYTKSLERTIKALEDNGLPTHNFELHVPIILNRKKLLSIIEQYPDVKGTRSLYGNTFLTKEMYYLKDVKIFDMDSLPSYGQAFLSTEDKSFARGKVGEFIRDRFPNKSRWER